MQIVRKMPTPTETVIISTVVSMCGTFPASTSRSGSAMVMITPRIKLSARISHSLRDLVMRAPICVPMSVIEFSAPNVNSPSPSISMPVPMKNESIRSVETGAMVKHRSATVAATGSTEATASRSFSRIRFLLRKPYLQRVLNDIDS